MLALAYKNIKMSSFKSIENIQRKEGGPDRSVSDNQCSSVKFAIERQVNIANLVTFHFRVLCV